MAKIFIPFNSYVPSTTAVPLFTETLVTVWARVVSFNFPCRSLLIRFPISERLRITEPLGVIKIPSGKKTLAIASVSFSFQAETTFAITFEIDFTSSELLPLGLLSACTDAGINKTAATSTKESPFRRRWQVICKISTAIFECQIANRSDALVRAGNQDLGYPQ
jgi:hypothetical protein